MYYKIKHIKYFSRFVYDQLGYYVQAYCSMKI